jgi:hypothetical protein
VGDLEGFIMVDNDGCTGGYEVESGRSYEGEELITKGSTGDWSRGIY